jgi:membrane-associated phospholipid phosphatase
MHSFWYKITLFIVVCSNSFSQMSFYTSEPIRELPIGLIGINTSITSALLKGKKPTISPEEISKLNSQNINILDRTATKNYSASARKISDIVSTASMFLPALVLINTDAQKEWKTVGLMTVETYLLTAGITNITKELIQRKRPFLYNPNVPLSEKLHKDATSSFFSGHTSMTTASTFLTATMIDRYSPNNEFKPYYWSLSATIPLGVGYCRWKGGKHFVTDILVGYIVGAGIGILVPYLHRSDVKF